MGLKANCTQVMAIFHWKCDEMRSSTDGSGRNLQRQNWGVSKKNETNNLRITSCDGVVVVKLTPQGQFLWCFFPRERNGTNKNVQTSVPITRISCYSVTSLNSWRKTFQVVKPVYLETRCNKHRSVEGNDPNQPCLQGKDI